MDKMYDVINKEWHVIININIKGIKRAVIGRLSTLEL